jgi:hypothetical protein
MTPWWEQAKRSFGETVRMRSDRAAYVSVAEARRQEATVQRVLQIFDKEPGALIADDVGMGKTYEALALAAVALAHGRWKRVYILTPGKPVRRKWEEDLYQFASGNVLDEDVRDQLRRALAVIRRERADDRDDDGDDDDDGDAEPRTTARTEYMSRLLNEARLEEPGIIFLHRSMLVGNSTIEEREFFVSQGLRVGGRNAKTIEPRMKRWGLAMSREAPAWLEGASPPRSEDIETALSRSEDGGGYGVLLRATRNGYLRRTLPRADLLIVDEAHGLSARKYREAVRDVLRPLADRVLLLSATPFQTSPRQIEALVAVLWNDLIPSEFDGAGSILTTYVEARDALRDAWNQLEAHEVDAARAALAAPSAPAFGGARRVLDAWLRALEHRQPAATLLRRFVVRSVRREKSVYRLLRLGAPAAPVCGSIDDDTLVERRGGGIAAGDDEVLVLAAERLLRELRRGSDRTFVAQIRQSATSSYAALLDWIKEGLRPGDDGAVRFERSPGGTLAADTGFYAKLVRDLVEGRACDPRRGEHPKVEAVAAEVARNAARGDKTLVFCGRRQTVSAIVSAASEGVAELLHQRYGAGRERAEFERDRERLREDLRYRSRRLGVLLRENPVRTVLPRLLGMPCVPGELRKVDEALIDAVQAALGREPMAAGAVIHACAQVVLQRIQSSSWRNRASTRERALAESEAAVLSRLRSAARESEDDPGDRLVGRPPSRAAIARICRHLLRGADVFGPFAGLLAGLDVQERPLAIEAVRLALTSPVILSPLVETYRSAADEVVLGRVAAGLQQVALVHGRAIERLLSPGIGDRHERLRRAVEAYRAGDAVVALESSSEEAEAHRQLLFNAPFYPLCMVATQRFGQGIDLHRECSRVIHHDGHWNPAVVEQHTGRIDRIHSRTARLREQGEPAQLYVDHPFIAGTVDEQILLRAFERASWYDALLGGKGLLVPKDESGDEQTSEAILLAERRFPYHVGQELAIDLSPASGAMEISHEQRGGGAFSPWPHAAKHAETAKAVEVERLLRALAYEGYLLTEEQDGSLMLEGVVGVSAKVRIRAAISEDTLSLSVEGGDRVLRALDSFGYDGELYGHFFHIFVSAAAAAERAALAASEWRPPTPGAEQGPSEPTG